MSFNDEKARCAIADEAAEWLVQNDAQSLGAEQAADLASWLRTSPVHIEEFLAVSAVASDLRRARQNPDYSLEEILARARSDIDLERSSPCPPKSPKAVSPRSGFWLRTAAAMTVVAALTSSLLYLLHKSAVETPVQFKAQTLSFSTRHGEQLTQRLADGSILRLNTDSSALVRYSNNERLVVLEAGQAVFQVIHEPVRKFRVRTRFAEIVDVGTAFDVRLDQGTTIVSVVEGHVAVAADKLNGGQKNPPSVELSANQQTRVDEGAGPTAPISIDAKRTFAWLHRQIVFDHEPLERVAAEYNRYTRKPIEIATPALRSVEISGTFATDDTEAFVAFLRRLKGVRVEVTATRILVTQE